MKLTFLGAAGEVTGSQHLIETSTARILLDCGLFQGRSDETLPKNENFRCTPQKLDLVILSHAHIDHCGRLPALCKAGYRGPIVSSHATADIAAIMLRDKRIFSRKMPGIDIRRNSATAARQKAALHARRRAQNVETV